MENPAPLETPEPARTASRFLLPAGVAAILLIVIAASAYAWYSLNSSCDLTSVREASAVLLSQMKVNAKEYQFIVTAERASLVRPVGVLPVCRRQKMS